MSDDSLEAAAHRVPLPNAALNIPAGALDPPEESKEARAPEDSRPQPSAPLEERKEDHAGNLIQLDRSDNESYSFSFESSGQMVDLLLPGIYEQQGESRAMDAELLQFPTNSDEDKSPAFAQRELSIRESQSSLHASSIKDDRWVCPICLELYIDPVETPCCHNLFCEKCVETLSLCPLCQRLLGRCVPNIPFRRLMEELSVKCRHKLCTAVVKRQDLKKHEAECDMALVRCVHSEECGMIVKKDYELHINEQCAFRPTSCPLECGTILPMSQVDTHVELQCPNANVECPLDCGNVFRRGDLEVHKKADCPNAVVKCTNVGSSGLRCPTSCLRRELDEHQLVCNYRRVTCPNSGCHERIVYIMLDDHDKSCEHKVVACANQCGQSMKRGLLEKHLDEVCVKQVVSCLFHHCGCGESLLRESLQDHLEKDSLRHSLLAAEKIEHLTREMIRMKNDIELLRSNHRDEVRNIYNEIRKVKSGPISQVVERRLRLSRQVAEEDQLLPPECNNAFDEFLRGLDPR